MMSFGQCDLVVADQLHKIIDRIGIEELGFQGCVPSLPAATVQSRLETEHWTAILCDDVYPVMPIRLDELRELHNCGAVLPARQILPCCRLLHAHPILAFDLFSAHILTWSGWSGVV